MLPLGLRRISRPTLARQGAAVATTLALIAGCTPLPDKNEVPERGTRPKDEDVSPVVRVDPCKRAALAQDKQAPAAQSEVIFAEDFENPKAIVEGECGEGTLDKREAATFFGSDRVRFSQEFTVETILLRDGERRFTDPKGRGGHYALGMLSDIQDDKLAITFDVAQPWINVELDISARGLIDCGDRPKISMPHLQVSLYDSPGGVFSVEDVADMQPLDVKTIDGNEPEEGGFVYNWERNQVNLDASGATGTVTLVFDLVEGGYAAIDNLSITAADQKGVVDADVNGVPDDMQCQQGGDTARPASTRPDGGAATGGRGAERDASMPRDDETTRSPSTSSSTPGASARPTGTGASAGESAPAPETTTMPSGAGTEPPATTPPDAGAMPEQEEEEQEEQEEEEERPSTRRPRGGFLGGITRS